MACPHFKRSSSSANGAVLREAVGTCRAHQDRVMVPSLSEQQQYCLSDKYDECPIYLNYIESCTKYDFQKILQDLKDSPT